jgi:dUTP pyrophosphatase
MKVKIKKLHANAKTPRYAKHGDAGMDLYAISSSEDDFGNQTYRTGIAMQIPPGHVGLLFPRSSVYKTAHALRNHVGIIDSGYRGEIMLKYSKEYGGDVYDAGDRIGQIIIMPYPQVEYIEVDDLSDTNRGTGGFGSTGT